MVGDPGLGNSCPLPTLIGHLSAHRRSVTYTAEPRRYVGTDELVPACYAASADNALTMITADSV